MDQTNYGLRVSVAAPYVTAVERTKAALEAEGFGVLTAIDVKDTLKQKLDRDFRRYVILGACNPELAELALDAELEVGLLLPCNVVVYEEDSDRTAIAVMAPISALGIVGDNPALENVAKEADQRLRRVLEELSD